VSEWWNLDAWLLFHFGITSYLVGLIWVIQVVHYPLFREVGSDNFPHYERSHTQRISWVVALPMMAEAICAVSLVFVLRSGPLALYAWLGIGLLSVIWLSTATLQMPCHERLSRGFDPVTHRRLVASNWIRTAAWTVRGVIAFYLALGVTG
jgi:hypothetical protein